MNFLCFKILLKTTLLFFITTPLLAWSQPEYLRVFVELDNYVPTTLIHEIYSGTKPLSQLTENPHGGFWVVYSDRANNPLYDESGWENGDALDLMEPLVVKRYTQRGNETWLNVYSRELSVDDQSKRYHVNRGWIRINRLVLSHYSLLNHQSIPRKALALYSFEDFDISQRSEEMQYYYYQEPNESEYGEVAKRFRIFYIIKEEGPWVLLSTSDRLSEGEAKRAVLGWMPRRFTTPWDHRVCYEFSTDPATVQEYINDSIFVFSDNRALRNFMEQGLSPRRGNILRREKLTTNPIHTREMRMPILNNLDDFGSWNMKQVVTINWVADSISDFRQAEIDSIIHVLESRKRMVNILFVLDATHSMRHYIPRVTQSMIKVIQNQRLAGAQTELRFGLAVYRDYPDEVNNQLFEIMPLTTNHQAVIDKIRGLWIGSVAETMAEAKFHGLVNGIEQAGFDPLNSNVVVLVGDCGNHRNDPRGYSKDQVIEALTKYNANLISFQVVYGINDSYSDFNWNVQDILRGIALIQAQERRSVRLEQSSFKNTYQLEYPGVREEVRSLFPFGRFTHASMNKPMDPTVLENNIVDALQLYFQTVENSINILNNLIEEGGSVDPVFIAWLHEQLKLQELTDAEINEVIRGLSGLGEITARGYLSTKHAQKENDAFVPVVFLSQTEHQQIIRMLQNLTRGVMSITERKKAFQDALSLQTARMLGEDNLQLIGGMTLDQIWQVILAVPFTGNPEIAVMRLESIATMSNEKFNSFYSDFQQKAENFISADYRNRRFQLSQTYFYWIPLEDIPGNE